MYEGFALPHAAQGIQFGGREVNDFLRRLLTDLPEHIKTNPHVLDDIAGDIKEKLCFVGQYADGDTKSAEEERMAKNYELPDGEVITIQDAVFQGPEVLFHPSLAASDLDGIHNIVFNSIMHSDPTIRNILFQNIQLCGRGSLFAGLPERLGQEICRLAGGSVRVRVASNANRGDASWLGGSVFASLDTFNHVSVTRAEYDEFGPCLARRRFL